MNIIYDHQIFSRQSFGGISRYFYEISNRIPTLEGDSVQIFSPLYVNQYGNKSQWHGILVPKFPGRSLLLGMINNVAGKVLIRKKKDVSIFHETYYSGASYAPPDAKRIVTVYDMIHELFPETFPKLDMTRRVKKQAVQRADHVICISENTRNDLVRILNVPIEKTSVVYLGCTLTLSHATPAKRMHLNKPYLLYVGNRGGYKNFKNLLVAYAELAALKNEISLVCFGSAAFSDKEQLEMKHLGLNLDNIKYIYGDDGVLSNLYSFATALVYPSLYEGFGIPPLEAMAHGCPVICANTSSLPEVVGNAAELFDPYDSGSLRAAIEKVIHSSAISKRLIELGYARVQNFSWDKCARATLDQYHRILES